MPFVAIDPANRCPLSNATQVFEGECLAGHDGFVHELLTDAMIGVFLEASFTPPHPADTALGVARPTLLQALAAKMEASAHFVDLLTGEALPRTIRSQIDDSEIHTQYAIGRWGRSGSRISWLCVTCR